MSAIQFDKLIPKNIRANVKGELLREYSPEDLPLLDQDILEISLSNGMRVDVGWFPENDPAGRFIIRVFRKNKLSPVRTPIEEKSPLFVARYVVDLVEQYGSPAPEKVVAVSWATTRSFDFCINQPLIPA